MPDDPSLLMSLTLGVKGRVCENHKSQITHLNRPNTVLDLGWFAMFDRLVTRSFTRNDRMGGCTIRTPVTSSPTDLTVGGNNLVPVVVIEPLSV